MPGMREALEEKFDELDGEVAPGVDAVEVEAPASAEAAGDAVEAADSEPAEPAVARGPDGKFVSTPAQGKPTPLPAGPAAGQGAPGVVAVAPAAPALSVKPPQSWNAAEREAWARGDIEGVRKASLRREQEITKALQDSAEARKGTEGWSNTVRPYEAQIRATGADPQKYVGDLLQTAHALNYGDPQSKAELMANLLMQFRIPLDVLDRTLAAKLGGQAPQAQQQPARDPRLDQFFQGLEQQKAEAAAAQQAEAAKASETFGASHEFYEDVREDMADIFDVWAKRGKKDVSAEDMERAYGLACQNNEYVSQALDQRKAIATSRTAQAATDRSRAAASSIRSTPTAAPAAQPAGRRAALEAAYDSME